MSEQQSDNEVPQESKASQPWWLTEAMGRAGATDAEGETTSDWNTQPWWLTEAMGHAGVADSEDLKTLENANTSSQGGGESVVDRVDRLAAVLTDEPASSPEDVITRCEALEKLAGIGEDAQPALPAILKSLCVPGRSRAAHYHVVLEG